MTPTLLGGDFLIVDANRARARECERGDLVVFKYPPAPEVEYLKRVVGLPGDTLEIRRGRLHVNGEPVTAPLGDGESVSAVESFGVRRYRVVAYTREVVPRIVVPEGTVFVLGDNRVASADSRFYGPVPLENVVAVPLGVVASMDSKGDSGVRWGRFGKRL